MKKYIGWLFLLGILGSGFAQTDFKIIKNKKKVVIPFKTINNLIFIPVVINKVPLTFLLDTGVEQTIIFSLDENEELKLLNVESIKLKGLGSKEAIDAYSSTKNKIEIKEFVDENHEIYVVLNQEFNFSSQVGIPVNGIIGYDFFKNHKIEINYSKKKITIYSDVHKKNLKKLRRFSNNPITLELNKPYLYATVYETNKSKSLKFLLDTGNSDALWFFSNKNKNVSIPSITIDDFLGRGFSGDIFGKRGRIESFTFGKHTFENPIATYPDSVSIKSVNFVKDRAGSIGGELLSRFTIVFDYPNLKIYTTPNAKLNEEFHFNMSGIEVEHAGLEWVKETYEGISKGIKIVNNSEYDKNSLQVRFELKPIFKISNIRKNSTADQAGLKKGDRVMRVNGINTHGLSIEKINQLLKSEEGKNITIEVERNQNLIKIKFQLKRII